MSEDATTYSGKTVVIGLVSVIFLIGGIWGAIESQMPILDKDTGKRFSARYEKHCMRALPRDKCKERAGPRHVDCMLKSASEVGDGIEYDYKVYSTCIDAN